jgi:hypothetical protein
MKNLVMDRYGSWNVSESGVVINHGIGLRAIAKIIAKK